MFVIMSCLFICGAPSIIITVTQSQHTSTHRICAPKHLSLIAKITPHRKIYCIYTHSAIHKYEMYQNSVKLSLLLPFFTTGIEPQNKIQISQSWWGCHQGDVSEQCLANKICKEKGFVGRRHLLRGCNRD